MTKTALHFVISDRKTLQMSVSVRRDDILSTSFRAIRFQPRRQFPFGQDNVTSGKGRDGAYDVAMLAQRGTDATYYTVAR